MIAYDYDLKSKKESTEEEGKKAAVDEEKLNPSLQAQDDAEEDESVDPKKKKETKSRIRGYGLGMLSSGKSESSREDFV